MRKHRSLVLGASLLALALIAGACNSGGDDNTGGGGTSSAAEKPTLTIGVSFAGPESQLVAEMYAQVLENAGYTVNREFDIADRDTGDKLLASGDIDLKPEYTGFELFFWDPKATVNGDPQTVADALAAAAEPKGLVIYQISPANSTNVFLTLPKTAEDNNLTDMSSLASVAPKMVFGAQPDCPTQPPCLPGLKKTYGIKFAQFKPIEVGPAMVAAIANGAVDVGELFSLDPSIADNGFTVLTDDKNLQANGNFVPLVRKEVASDELGTLLDGVTTALTDENMRQMIGEVQNEHKELGDVAGAFLQEQGLLS